VGHELKADELVGLRRGEIYVVGMIEKRRGLAKLGAEDVVVGGVAAAEVSAGREKQSWIRN